jgi:hypothetical protein
MSAPSDRLRALECFVAAALAPRPFTLAPASADASYRSYWRASLDDGGAVASVVVMDAPPDKEDLGPWLEVARRLRAAGLHAPEVFAVDRRQGFVLMEDLGTRPYLPELDEARVETLYGDALTALLRMQTAVDARGLPAYDASRLSAELELMPEWFLRRHLGVTIDCEAWDTIELAFRRLLHEALAQPRVFVHRDYHSRNLLIVPTDNPGIVDFQDAVVGPITYDLVSLLRDCYIAWDEARVETWREAYRARLAEHGVLRVPASQFRRWFDLMGLQRHLKVLGIFCRLWYRDGKPRYLADLPRVWQYAERVARRYPELAEFTDLLAREVDRRDLTVPRVGPSTAP